jgi:hypothetical protein
MNKTSSLITRRKLLKDVAVAGMSGAMIPLTGFVTPNQQKKKKGGLIEAENSKPGTLEWQLQFTDFDTPVRFNFMIVFLEYRAVFLPKHIMYVSKMKRS